MRPLPEDEGLRLVAAALDGDRGNEEGGARRSLVRLAVRGLFGRLRPGIEQHMEEDSLFGLPSLSLACRPYAAASVWASCPPSH